MLHEPKPNFAANPVLLEQPKIYDIPKWNTFDDRQKLATIRLIIKQYGEIPECPIGSRYFERCWL